MRVMVLGKANPNMDMNALPSKEAWEEMDRFNEELQQAGILVIGEGLLPGVHLRFTGKKGVVMDGPFVETKEVIAGYSIWEVKSMEEAIAWASRCPLADGSEVELRPIFTYTEEDVSEIMQQDA